ncbi:hypothetical protein TRIP_B250141 [uncultured Desulfatiglans sp.]|uniref:J domain-containing protein n=1 Tax=Uncultured Desulfatiglans sp. TaxID=1748965 RepID=A0A653A501_UNCDX|nr:hypothetical protein TRIP_B250141 [uncultured Desulfatiglans sp.]
MDLKRCYEVLEVGPDADPDEIRKAYRDLASVWHPDRFAGNERLSGKAAEKIKEINVAYETLSASWKSRPDDGQGGDPSRSEERDEPERGRRQPETETQLERLVETGTGLVLSAYSRLSRAVRSWLESGGADGPGSRPAGGRGAGGLAGGAGAGRGCRRAGGGGRRAGRGRRR